jgi:hypothetical protein
LLKVNQVIAGELFAVNGVGSMLGDVSLDQATLKDIAYT